MSIEAAALNNAPELAAMTVGLTPPGVLKVKISGHRLQRSTLPNISTIERQLAGHYAFFRKN